MCRGEREKNLQKSINWNKKREKEKNECGWVDKDMRGLRKKREIIRVFEGKFCNFLLGKKN